MKQNCRQQGSQRPLYRKNGCHITEVLEKSASDDGCLWGVYSFDFFILICCKTMEMVIGVLHSIKHDVFIIPFRTNETVGVRGEKYTQLLNVRFLLAC